MYPRSKTSAYDPSARRKRYSPDQKSSLRRMSACKLVTTRLRSSGCMVSLHQVFVGPTSSSLYPNSVWTLQFHHTDPSSMFQSRTASFVARVRMRNRNSLSSSNCSTRSLSAMADAVRRARLRRSKASPTVTATSAKNPGINNIVSILRRKAFRIGSQVHQTPKTGWRAPDHPECRR